MSEVLTETDIVELDIPSGILEKLRAAGVKTVEELLDHSIDELKEIPGIGDGAISKIQFALEEPLREGPADTAVTVGEVVSILQGGMMPLRQVAMFTDGTENDTKAVLDVLIENGAVCTVGNEDGEVLYDLNPFFARLLEG